MKPIKRVRILKITHPIKLNWSRNNLVFLPFIKFQLVFKASIPDFVLSSAIRKNTWENPRLTIIRGIKINIMAAAIIVPVPDWKMGEEFSFKRDGSIW